MIEKLKYLFAGILILSLAGCFVACDKDDQTETDEWGSNYVYLERPALSVNSFAFKLSHTSLGVSGSENAKIPLSVRLLKASASDVVVTFACTIEGDLPQEAIAFRKGGKVVIPAGELGVRDTMYFDSDWKFASKDAAEYKIKVKVGSVEPVSGDLRISSKQNDLAVSLTKTKMADVIADVKPSGSRIDRSGWVVSATASQEADASWTEVSDLTDGDNSSYVWYNAPYLGVKMDLGSTLKLSGLEAYDNYGANYAMSSCAIYSSTDGVQWTLITPEGNLAITRGYTQYVSFAVPVTARYIIWHMYGPSCLCSEVYVYTN